MSVWGGYIRVSVCGGYIRVSVGWIHQGECGVDTSG